MAEEAKISDSISIQLKKYYVYALIDPRSLEQPDQGIFYVGKGQNDRAKAHVKNAVPKRLNSVNASEIDDDFGDRKDPTDDDQRESEKNQRIQTIEKNGAKVLECVLGRFDTEAEAYAVESVLIQWVYGRSQDQGQLTNIQPGHNRQHVRSKGSFVKNEYLDIPKKIRSDSGEYSAKELQKLMKKNVPDMAEIAVHQLRELISKDPELHGKVVIDQPTIVESGRYVGAVVKFGEPDVILRLQFTSNSLIPNLRARDENKQESRNQFRDRMNSVGLQTYGKDHYGRLPHWENKQLRFTDYEGAMLRIKESYEKFQTKYASLTSASS
jgi:hypothetical protein